MNKQEIITVLYELHKISGFRVSLHGADFAEIAAYPATPLPFCRAVNESGREHAMCLECDRLACTVALEKKETYIYKCRYGLTEAVSPLYNFDTLTGFLMMGQIADSPSEVREAESALSLLIGRDGAHSLSGNIPVVSRDMTASYVKIMTICAQYLTLKNALPAERPSAAELAKKYIAENIDKRFGISDICDYIGYSKSTLLGAFKKKYGKTVNDYVTELRLERAKNLLSESGRTICEVAGLSGFNDQSYFSKVFSKKYGISPTEYRKLREGETK